MTIDALTLGLDGIIFDTEDLHLRACNAAFERCGLGLRWTVQQLRDATYERGATNALAMLIDKLGLSAASPEAIRLHEAKNAAFHELAIAGNAQLFPACEMLMEEAIDNGCKLALITDMPAATATVMLDQAFGNAVTYLLSVVMCGANFDAPADNGPHQIALRTLGVEPSGCVAIDTAAPSLCAAKRAGIWTMAVASDEGLAHIPGSDGWHPQMQVLVNPQQAPHQPESGYLRFNDLVALKSGYPVAMHRLHSTMQTSSVV